MKTRTIAERTYRKVMQRYQEEDQKRTEVIRTIGNQRIQTSREQAAALYAFHKSLTNTGLKSSNN